jgi:exodeoxyribonuclease V gamma subunit
MSVLYLGSDPASLADRLADNLDQHARHGDFFTPLTIVVPNRFLRKWLRIHLARKHGVAINLRFEYLEKALWKLLQEVDPAGEHSPPRETDENVYRLMVLAVLLESKDANLAPLRRYLQLEKGPLSRLSCRRAWDLADRIGMLLRDYEYARQDALIQPWLQHKLGLSGADAFHQMMERAQRALFLEITREPDGKRALLNRHSEQIFKTFPQYAMERMTDSNSPTPTGRTVHFFGFTQICELHARTIAWLGRSFDVHFYHLNVLSARFGLLFQREEKGRDGEAPAEPEPAKDNTLVQGPGSAGALPSRGEIRIDLCQIKQDLHGHFEGCGELLRSWSKAGEEAFGLLTPFTATGAFSVERLPANRVVSGDNVLARLRDQLLGNKTPKTRLPQDTSVQIVACPGVMREAETVYNSILYNLQNDASLKQNDVAVLVTDMTKYRAALQAVFERPPRRLQYNLVDYSAAGASMFGQAVLGILDLALESFSRSRVFAVLLNPCFLARLRIDRTEAMTWLSWAENLGICQGWDAEEKAQQGYPRSPLYAWRLGLQRLRLGRYMEMTVEGGEMKATRFGEVIPFADLESTDREHLDAFCRAVEGLLPTLANLRTAPLSGERWAKTLTRLVQEFLDVPADRPEEGQVRADLFNGLNALGAWDSLHDPSSGAPRPLSLALVREYVRSQLEVMPGNHGEYLIGGVTISALQPMRPLPFEIVYILGLSENLFPGSNALSSFDLRGVQRIPGDIRPAEARQYDFLATVLSAQRKLYLLYNSRDLQKDQELLPAVPLQQMQRSLSRHILQEDCRPVAMPLHGDDPSFFDPQRQPAYQDVLVQHHALERCLGILEARRENRLSLSKRQEAEWEREWPKFKKDFTIAAVPRDPLPSVTPVSIGELRRFLRLPAQASLRRHLHIEEDDEYALEDDEPLVTPQRVANGLARQTIQRLVLDAAQSNIDVALKAWPERFNQAYADLRLCSRVPEEAFGEIDQAALLSEMRDRIDGKGQIEAFLREHASMAFCGPMLLGESLTPLGAKLHFPALRLRAGHELSADAESEIRIVGSTPFAWHARGVFEILVVTNIKEIDGRSLCEAMFEPMLIYLALLAGSEPNADGIISQSWLAGREFALNIGHRGGIQRWSYPAGDITAAEAQRFLVDLTRDLLDPTSFDLLPFEAIVRSKTLRLALMEDVAAPMGAETFRAMLEEYLNEQRENPRSPVKIPLWVEMVRARVPADALAKVRRRFPLLDRGPARLRRHIGVRNTKLAKVPAP